MGPRIREDNEEEGQQDSSAPLRCARNDMWGGGRWVPAPVFTRALSLRRRGGMDSRLRLHEGRLYAGVWVPRIREDNGRGAGMVRV